MAAAAILTAVTIGKEVVSFGKELFGGGGDDTPVIAEGLNPCPNQPSDESLAVAWGLAPASTKQALIQIYTNGNGGVGPPPPIGNGPNPYAGASGWFAFAKAIMGGSDCVNKSGPSGPSMLLEMVARYGGGNQSPIYTAAVMPQAQPKPSAGDYLREIGDNLKTAADNILRSTLGGAVAGAQSSTQGAATGSAIPMTVASSVMPLALLGGGILLVMLMRRK